MKWFKHFSDSLDDPFIQELMDRFGHQGYTAFFGLIEIIAKENGSELTGKLVISPTYLKRKLRISAVKLKEIYTFCSGKVEQNLGKSSTKVEEKFRKSVTKPKLFFNFSKENWQFDFPKLLELKDNYIKDLQAPCKKVSLEVEVEEEEEEEEEEEAEEEYIYNFWNGLKIIQHRDYQKYRGCINAKLANYAKDEITEAMKNYKTVLEDDKYYWTHKWGLDEFMSRKGGLDKFLTNNKPFENFIKDGKNGKHNKHIGLGKKNYNEGTWQ